MNTNNMHTSVYSEYKSDYYESVSFSPGKFAEVLPSEMLEDRNDNLQEPFPGYTEERINEYKKSEKKFSVQKEIKLRQKKPYDVFYARFNQPTFGTMIQDKDPKLLEHVREVVIGTDDRKPIEDTTKFPSRSICKLYITAADGSSWVGSGTFIGPNCLLTAAHCVYVSERGGWVSNIEVVPGLNREPNRPFESTVATKFHCPNGYLETGRQEFDFAAIITERAYGEELGQIGLEALSDDQLRGLLVTVCGYPADIPLNEYRGEIQYYHTLGIKSSNRNILYYELDTAGGQSGSSVLYLKNGKIYSCGIHNIGSITGNSATRITNPILNIINAWKTESP
jgi:V8-like Glu-specific endopeptidase